jgi:hypothetical protein
MGWFGISPVGIRGEYGGRNTRFTFEIKVDLNNSGKFILEGKEVSEDQTDMAA